MDIQPGSIFQLEDGGSLAIAVHTEVPQHARICEIIQANRGIVVGDASSADFCIISLVAPNSEGIAEELGAEDKVAVQEYWIRDSVYAKRLLPWYSYQVVASPSSSAGFENPSPAMSDTELEERDLHELVVISARYWPLFSMDELHRYVAKKCPHRTAASFKKLYATRQDEIKSRVIYLRRRLDSVLTFRSDFISRPRLSFGSPNKSPQLQAQFPLMGPGVSFMPTPTATSGSLGERPQASRSRTSQGIVTPQQEIPYEPPNIGDSTASSPAPSSPPAYPNPPKLSIHAHTSGDVITSEDAAPRKSAEKQITGSTAGVAPELARRSSSPLPMGQIVTREDKHELAKFLAEYPKGQLGFKKHIETFRKINHRGRLRTSNSWHYVYRQYGREIRSETNRVLQRIAAKAPVIQKATPATGLKSRRSSNVVQSPVIHDTMVRSAMTSQDKDALALWLLDHPIESTTSQPKYFGLFRSKYEFGSRRSAVAWASAATRHKEDLLSRQKRILRERGESHRIPTLTCKAIKAGASREATEDDESADEPDSDLSSVWSGSLV